MAEPLDGRKPTPTEEAASVRVGAPADAAAAWQMLLGIAQAARLMPERRTAAPGSIQFTLITGFLGAGKTTLVNHVLSYAHGLRIAVIVNDFGAINIDAALISKRDGDTISLANGCVCCSMARGLTETILGLTEQAKPPDAIVLEASGITEPQPTLHIALTNPALALNGVIALIDTETVLEHAADAGYGAIVVRQVTGADLVVLNKSDLTTPQRSADVHAWVGRYAPRAGIIKAIEARVPMEIVLGQSSTHHDVGDLAMADRADHQEPKPFRSWSFVLDEGLRSDSVRALTEALPAGILRAKGTLYLADAPDHRHVFQLVGRRWRLARDIPWDGARKRSEIVFISADTSIAEARLEACIRACIAD